MTKKAIPSLILLLIIIPSLLCLTPKTKAAPTTTISIEPQVITVTDIGETFTVNITVTDVTDLYGWQIPLYYKSSILNATSINFAPQWQSPIGYNWIVSFTDNYNGTHGLIFISGFLLGEVSGLNGKILLATITFKALAYGNTPLYIDPIGEPPDYTTRTKLIDSTRPFGQEISHTVEQGRVHVGLIDIAVKNTHISKTYTNDTTVYINVTVENQGIVTLTFDLIVFCGETPIDTKTVADLTSMETRTYTFSLDTTPIPKGTYTISATAVPAQGEIDPADNTLIDGTITETIRGDVNGDFKVDITDVFQFAKAFGTTLGHPKWNPNCDLNNDEKINIEDIFHLARNFGKSI
jgi:hypothetical protein